MKIVIKPNLCWKEVNLTKRNWVIGVLAGLLMVTGSLASASTVSSDFSFGSGAPFGGTTTLSGVTVTLSSTVTQPFGSTSFRDLVSGEDASVKFVFSEAISEFSLDVSRVRADEFLTNFNIGNPDNLSGTLAQTTSGVGTVLSGDFNSGTLSWNGLNTQLIEFDITTANGAALAVDSFSFDATPVGVVPLPASILFLGFGLLGFVAVGRRTKV